MAYNTYPIEKFFLNMFWSEDDKVYINSEQSGKQWGHIISEFPSVLFSNKLLNIAGKIKSIKISKHNWCLFFYLAKSLTIPSCRIFSIWINQISIILTASGP